MSTSFTVPAGQSWQTLLSELTTAYSERRQAIAQSAYTPTAERNVQSSAYWRTLQQWLESNCTSFIDHVNGPLRDSGNYFRSFTLKTWRAAAGINENGFRRSTLAGGTDYGYMQAGDAIGEHIFEDLQNGLAALKWTAKASSDNIESQRDTGSSIPAQCAINYATVNANFASMRWGVDRIGYPTWYYADVRYEDKTSLGFDQHWMLGRGRGKARIIGLPLISRAAVVYARPAGWNFIDGGQYLDIDNLGMEAGKMSHVFDLVASSESVMTTEYFGNTTTNPNTGAPNSPNFVCSGTPSEQNYQRNIQFYRSFWLLKWNFTNA